MSAGPFASSRYQADYDTDAIHPIRVQPETLEMENLDTPAIPNAGATGSVNNPISAIVSLGNRALGLRPRRIIIKFNDSTPLAGYDERSVLTLPVLTRAFFDSVEKDDSVTYLGRTWLVVNKDAENTR